MRVLAWLVEAERVGFTFESRGGKLVVSPASRLDAAGDAFVRAHRDELLELVEGRAELARIPWDTLGVPPPVPPRLRDALTGGSEA